MPVIRIGFDSQTFILQRYGGISRYFADLYLGLNVWTGVQSKLLFNWHQNAYLEAQNQGKMLGKSQLRFYAKAMKLCNAFDRISEDVDIHHSTYYLGRPAIKKHSAILVSTLHDMVPELNPHYYRKYPHANKVEWFTSSDLIISVSETSAADLAYFHPRLASRIKRIHLYTSFTSDTQQIAPKELYEDVTPYFLYIGDRNAYKNTALLLRAFALSNPKKHCRRLIFAGGGALGISEREAIDRLGLSRYVLQIDVSDANLWYLYCNATAVIVPSMGEGFSLPVVEGLAADVPIISSDIPVHREVGKDFAYFVNPCSHCDWADILQSAELLAKPSSRLGPQQYSKLLGYFSRERMIAEHIYAYKDL